MKNPDSDDDLLPEYDFSGATRANYAARYAEGTNVIVLDPDVAEVFRDSRSVNDALRALVQIIRNHPSPAASR
jgi:hypothetical protein